MRVQPVLIFLAQLQHIVCTNIGQILFLFIIIIVIIIIS